MKRVILSLAITISAMATAQSDADACFSLHQLSASNAVLIQVSEIDRRCLASALSYGIFVGQAVVATHGQGCHYLETTGATACESLAAEYQPWPDVNPAGCEVVVRSYLRELGCCQTPCPPAFPDCHAN